MVPSTPLRRARRLSRGLRALARACGVTLASGPGCFLFCYSNGTHLTEREVTTWTDQWSGIDVPTSPATGVWTADVEAWIVGPGGASRSTDSGFTWTAEASAPTGLAAVDGLYDAEVAWAAGAGGRIGTLGSAGFHAQRSSTDVDLAAISVGDDAFVVAVGADGVVLTTEDAGETWAREEVADVDLLAVQALITGTTWVGGEAGLLLRGDDEGWIPIDLGTPEDVVAIGFASATRGMVATSDGGVWWTADAGETWASAPAPGAVTGLAFTGREGQEQRYAVGPDGIVWSFDGAAWTEEARTADGAGLAAIDAGTWEIAAVGDGDALVWGGVPETHTEMVEVEDCPPYVGRPYVVDGEVRLAPVHGPAADARAERWRRQAQEEHASVAAFARITLQLLALGAPADLVRDTVAAQADELRHTELCRARAQALGSPCELGPLDVSGGLGALTLVEVAVAAAREGCVIETVSAWHALAAAEATDDADERRTWRTIAADETRHAALAWRFVAWALAQDPAVAAAVAPVFATRPSSVPAAVWHQVVRPAAAGLLARTMVATG